ncbi:MAG: hypothetical protein QNK04_30170 [Myxococcota bacterium]|nr:hypothetical protein [Myxococcota bacterium]
MSRSLCILGLLLAFPLCVPGLAGAKRGEEPTPPPAAEAPDAGAPPQGRGFPSPEQLEQLRDAPPPGQVFRLDARPVDEWRLAGPFPKQVGAIPHTDDSPWGELLSDVVARRAGLVASTEAMHCVARELGRFFLAHRGRPSESLKRFIMGRCHATVADVAFGYVDGRVPPRFDEAELFSHWRGAVETTIERAARGGPRSVGIWFGHEGGQAVAMVAYGRREVLVEPFDPFAGEDHRVQIRGEALEPSVRVSTLVNRGRFGVASCERREGVEPPRFDFTCEVDPKDPAAAVALSVTPPERLLSRAGLSLLVWPGKSTVDVYRAPRYAEPRTVAEDSAVAKTFVELLNGVRSEAGLEKVQLDPVQSEAARELAPHFFAAVFDQAPEFTADLVVLGMIAGWGVDGVVESGHFSAAWVVRSNDLGRLLSNALEYPVSREALLAEGIDRVAVGSLLDTTSGSEALAAVFGTYSLFSAETHAEIAQRVYERLDAERTRKGMGEARRLGELEGLFQRAASMVGGGGEPADAMNMLLRESVDVLRAPVSGWVAEVSDLDQIEFPQEYLSSPTLRVGVAVTHKRREGEPWGHYVVMLVVSDPEAWGA